MEFEDVSAEVEREARRVAAAFGMQECECGTEVGGDTSHIYLKGEFSVEVVADDEVANLLQVGRRQGEYCQLFRDYPSPDWNAYGELQGLRNIMVRALYFPLGVLTDYVLALESLICPCLVISNPARRGPLLRCEPLIVVRVVGANVAVMRVIVDDDCATR